MCRNGAGIGLHLIILLKVLKVILEDLVLVGTRFFGAAHGPTRCIPYDVLIEAEAGGAMVQLIFAGTMLGFDLVGQAISL